MTTKHHGERARGREQATQWSEGRRLRGWWRGLAVAVLSGVMGLVVGGGASRGEAVMAAGPGPQWEAGQVVAVLERLIAENPDWSLTGPPQVTRATVEAAPAMAPDAMGGQVGARWQVLAEITGPGLASPVKLEALGFPRPLDALGLYATSVRRNSLPAPYALAAYWTGQVLNIWRGEIYLRLQLDPETPPTALEGLTNSLLPLLPLDEAPLLWRLLPTTRLASHTLERSSRPLQPLPAARDCLRGDYRENGRRLSLVLWEFDDPDAAGQQLSTLLETLQPRRPPQPLSTFETATLLLTSAQHGLSLIMHEDRYLAALLNIHDRDLGEGLLRILGTHIRTLPHQPPVALPPAAPESLP